MGTWYGSRGKDINKSIMHKIICLMEKYYFQIGGGKNKVGYSGNNVIIFSLFFS